MRTWFFVSATLISGTLASVSHALLGTSLSNLPSPSTCALLAPNGNRICSATLLSGGRLQSASHCFYNLWFIEGKEEPSVACDFGAERGFGFRSVISKDIHVSKTTNFKKGLYSDDQMIATLKIKPDNRLIARTAKADELQRIFSETMPGSDSRGLNPEYSCAAESFQSGNPSSSDSSAGLLPSAQVKYSPSKKVIDLEYAPIPLNTPEKIAALENARDENDGNHLRTYYSVFRLLKAFPVPVLTHAGDSGGSLYCFKTSDRAQTQVLVGVLSRGLTRVEKDPSGTPSLLMGARWNTPIDESQMTLERLKKKSLNEIYTRRDAGL